MTQNMQKIWIHGTWREADAVDAFTVVNPSSGQVMDGRYPVSSWVDCDAALSAAADTFFTMRSVSQEKLAVFLEVYADAMESHIDEIVDIAHTETALPKSPRLRDVEFPRTTFQLRQAANVARTQTWRDPQIDAKANIRSCFDSIGPVFILGPNNFPLAYSGICGGDFASAIATGNPVIAKAHPLHPGTTHLLATLADQVIQKLSLPPAMVQMIYHMAPDSGLRVVADHRLGATAYTGSRRAGEALKAASDRAGNPIYLEMSSINPVVLLPGALADCDAIAEQFTNSCLLACGQFCTNPGLVILPAGDEAERFIANVAERFKASTCGVMLATSVVQSLSDNLKTLCDAGAIILAGRVESDVEHCTHEPTLLRITGDQFIDQPSVFQTEAFGPASLLVVVKDVRQVCAVIEQLEGNLTGCIYHAGSVDRQNYLAVEPMLRYKVGRLLNNKMPTGVTVTAAMNHGGPYPASGHPGFTAVGMPPALRRFAALRCYDNVDSEYLPSILRD